MAGRAGRRGLDKVGTVLITSWAELPSETTLKRLLTGTPSTLTSQFRLTYNMIVNLLRVNDLSVEAMMKRSFSEYHTQKAIASQDIVAKMSRMEAAIKFLETDISGSADICVFAIDSIADFVKKLIYCSEQQRQLLKCIEDNRIHDISMSVGPGRVVFLMLKEFFCPALGVVLSKPRQSKGPPGDATFEVLAFVPEAMIKASLLRGCIKKTSSNLSYISSEVTMNDIILVGDGDKLNVRDSSDESILATLTLLSEKLLNPKSIGCFNLINPYKVKDIDFAEIHQSLQKQSQYLLEQLEQFLGATDFYMLFPKVYKLHKLEKKLTDIKSLLSNENLALFPDFQQKMNVLKILNYVEADNTLTMKGRVACEMTTSNELLATEIIFHNILEPMNPPEVAAILSALVFQEKTVENSAKLTSRMEIAREKIEEIYEALNTLQAGEGIFSDPENKAPVNFGLSAAVYQWSRGVSFKDVKVID